MISSAASEKLAALATPFVREAGAQPIPGYRLTGLIGHGWAGEVWKCEAPGGLHKAIKFVPDVRASCAGDAPAEELKAVQRIKALRHPFLLSIERVEFVGGDLAIVMELADRDLNDLCDSFRQQGQPGIPRDPLLGYLREVAETLDLVNTQYDVQHLDVKPSNLFLVCNHIKIGDFGLVISLFGKEAAAGGPARAATPYLAPEVIQGGSARQSDQYSLAVLYQEMLTGTLPFHGATSEELKQAHLRDQPDLEPLPVADRSIIARALAKDPNLRFATCSEFIKTLVLGHVEVAIAPSKAGKPPRREAALTPAPEPATPAERRRDEAEDFPVPPAEDNDELPVYQFVRCLSRTLLTEVWDVHASNGRRRVAKVLFGSAGSDGAAVNRLLALRHPALAPLELVQHTPGRLVLAADPIKKSLRDCFQECRSKGLPAIPRNQLLGYLKAAAAALTELSRKEGLQHLGLNPRSLFLVGDQVRLADFGIAQLLWLPIGEPVSRMNPRYSAPELVQRKLSPACDQYSLALIYHELLTGQLPQTAGTGRPISLSDLQALPEVDRAVLARTLDTNPEKRWATCADLIDALEPPAAKVLPVDASLPDASIRHEPPADRAIPTLEESPAPPVAASAVDLAALPAGLPDRSAPEPSDIEPEEEQAVPAEASEVVQTFPLSSDEETDGQPAPLAPTTLDEPAPTAVEPTPSLADLSLDAPADPGGETPVEETESPSGRGAFLSGQFRLPTLVDDQPPPEPEPPEAEDTPADPGGETPVEETESPSEMGVFCSGQFRLPTLVDDQPPPEPEPPEADDTPSLPPEPLTPAPFLPTAGSVQAVLEARFGVNLSAATVRHQLDGVRRQWNGREVRRDNENLIFLMEPPRSFWKRYAAKDVVLQVHIHLKEAPPLVPAPTEVSVAVVPTEDTQGPGDLVAKTLGQMLLESIRAALQVNTKGRGHERLTWPHPLRLWPVHAGGRLGEPIDCQGKDLSLNGIGFYMPGEPPTKVIRLQLPRTDQTPAMTVPARVVRTHAFGDGWYEIGAILLMR